MADFFILRRYQKQGIGSKAARDLLDRFQSRWEIRVLAKNAGALAFWRTVVNQYTSGQFREIQWDDTQWRGPVLTFESGPEINPHPSS